MPIIRSSHSFDDNFTQIPNNWLRDQRLSYKARGVLAELLSHRPGWSVSMHQLANGLDGIHSIRSAVAELETHGYLVREQTRESGRFAEAQWVTGSPLSGFPTSVFPTSDNQTPKKTKNKEDQVKETLAQAELEAFDVFWDSYPRKTGKLAARKAFEKVFDQYGEQVIEAAKAFRDDPNLPNAQYIPHPATWLNGGRFLDGPLPEREKDKTNVELELIARRDHAEREHRLRLVREAEEARENEAPIPNCKHGLSLLRCLPCQKELAGLD
jgi:hypothetical protein